jgi:broad specificity phosphatase PhoE
MTKEKYIVVLRHGPTHSNETINYNSFVNFTSEMVVYLNNFLLKKGLDINQTTPQIYTSPYTRCLDTGKLIASYLEVLRNNKKLHVKTKSGVKRWDMKNEPRAKSIERATSYGEHVYSKVKASSEPEIQIYVTHSSIIPGFISGLVGKKLKKVRLHTACLSIINVETRELEVFNKSFK